MIEVRVADGTFVPVLLDATTHAHRLHLAVAHDDQTRVVVALYQEGVPVARLEMTNLPPRPSADTSLHLTASIDRNEALNVALYDRISGRELSQSVDLTSHPELDGLALDVDTDGDNETIIGEDAVWLRNTSRPPRRRGLVVILFIAALALAILAGWAIWRGLATRPDADAGPAAESPEAEAPIAEAPAPQTETPAPPTEAEAPPAAAPPPAEERESAADPPPPPDAPPSVLIPYLIRRGDTLWDISEAVYGTPWRYPEIARENAIRNPDLIYADSRIELPQP